MTVRWLIEEVKDALVFRGYMGGDSEGVQYVLTISGLEVKKPFHGKLSWSQIVQRLRGMVESGKIVSPADAPDEFTPEAQTLRRLDAQMRQAVAEPQQPAPVWHPYPAERPKDGQKVLTLCHSKYNRDNYAAYIYRAGSWYLPEMPDDGLMTPDVRWWSAELPPEE